MIKEHDLKIANEAYNTVTQRQHLENEICRSFHNQARIMKNLADGMAQDLVKVPKVEDKPPVMIIGSGPSFDRVAPYLKDFPGDIICSTSQASTCIYYGKDPKYIVALDPESHEFELMADDFAGKDTTLITHPGVTPELINFWQGKSLYFRKIQPQTKFYSVEQRLGYSTAASADRYVMINESVIMLACVAACQVWVANILGYGRMYLVGLDFGCPEGKERFTRWDYNYKKKKVFAPGNAPEMQIGGEWTETKPGPITAQYNVVGENGCITAPIQNFYKQQFITAWRIMGADFINVSSGDGMLYELPQASIIDVIKDYNRATNEPSKIGGFSRTKIKNTADVYLARHNIFVTEVSNGVSVMQFKEPLIEIPDMLKKMKVATKQQPVKVNVESNIKRMHKVLDAIGYKPPPKDLKRELRNFALATVAKIAELLNKCLMDRKISIEDAKSTVDVLIKAIWRKNDMIREEMRKQKKPKTTDITKIDKWLEPGE